MQKIMSNKWVILLFTLPTLAIFAVLVLYPLWPTVRTSFYQYNGLAVGDFVGVENYSKVLQDPVFWLSVRNSLKVLALQTLFAGPVSLLLALLLNECSPRMRRYVKLTFLLPTVLNVTVICLMWKMIFQPDWGVLDSLLRAVGLESLIHTWLIDQSTAMWCIAFVFVWQFIGYNMLLLYSGIRSIPESYIEAARIEGAGFWQRSFRVVIPLIQETIKFVLIISTTGCLAMFAHVQVMTDGGPGDLTRTIVFQLYYKAYQGQNFGQGNAIAVLFAILGIAVFLLINRFVARERIELV